jgi:uncharacterized membrane protein
MDKYAIACMFSLIIQCIWHGAIGLVIFLKTPEFRVTPKMWLTYVDHCAFFFAAGVFVCMHIILITWLCLVPLKHRRAMRQAEIQYALAIAKKKNRKKSPTSVGTTDESSPFVGLSIET